MSARGAIEARALIAATGFLTRLPVRLPDDTWQADLSRAPRYFPVVGGVIGALTGVMFWALAHLVPVPLAAALALAFEALLTGAFHEDALADFCDAFGGGRSPERVSEILKDSRIGAYGALGLMLGLLVRWAALMSLAPAFAIAASAAAGAIGRTSAVLAMRILPPVARRESLSKDVGARPSARATAFAVVTGLALIVPAALSWPWHALAAVLLAALPLLWCLHLMRRTLGGVVGDGLGAIAFVAQALALTAFASRP